MLYHDSGSEGFNDHHNVCADSPGLWWILINGDGDGNDVHDNYIDSTCKTTYASCAKGSQPSHCNPNPNPMAAPTNCSSKSCACHCSVTSNTFVARSADFPEAARLIMAEAGPDSWDSWAVTFHEPVVLHGAFKVPPDPKQPWLPANLTLDGNQSMVDTFYALDQSHLFGMYEVAMDHVERPLVASRDSGRSWHAAGAAVCHPPNNDGALGSCP